MKGRTHHLRPYVFIFILLSLVILYFLSLNPERSSENRPTRSVESEDPPKIHLTPLAEGLIDLSQVEVLSWSPRILLYHNFVTSEDADHIVSLGKNKVQRSEVVVEEGQNTVHESRSSSGVFLVGEMARDLVVQKYARKIAFWTQIPEENGEAFYLIRYNKGQEYQAHLDWFRSDETGQKELKEFGDRVATVLLYLSTPSEGGETEFPNIDLSVPAKKGNAVLFWDYAPNFEGDHSTLHAGKPVISGTKWCMTKWIREKSFFDYKGDA
eukprot:TRINITY_DN1904_c0_g2_i2.p1 TRINITY_DN1904_c0_g2~~TRINITY_DN1904_c0_g2_i2.p1  ORF type:complete len:268 (+),score=57.89 TRINITY_DN1904_c0_g2_i2:340-1143(+)